MESYVVEQDEMTANAFRAIWDLKSETKSDLKCPGQMPIKRLYL